MADWKGMPISTRQPMTATRALLLCLMALAHVQEESPGIEDWSKAEKFVRALLKQARQGGKNITP